MLKILIADDEVIECTVLKKRLKKYYKDECQILVAQNGREVLELYAANHPQVMILDIEMPGIDGLTAAKTIRKKDRRCSIIFLTAFDEFSYAKAAISVRALDYLLKPCDEHELITAVDEAIRIARQQDIDPKIEEGNSGQDLLLQEDTEDRSSEYRRQEDIRAYIEQNYMNDISVADIASYLGYSEAYFCRRFKQYFGHSFVSFLTDYRIRKAEELILVSRLSIKEVGKAVGYPDPNYFTKVFRRARGVSPTEYRESILAGE